MFIKDLLERVVRTFLVAFLVPVIAGATSVTDVETAKALVWAGVIAGGTAVLGVLSKFIGDRNTASIIETTATEAVTHITQHISNPSTSGGDA